MEISLARATGSAEPDQITKSWKAIFGIGKQNAGHRWNRAAGIGEFDEIVTLPKSSNLLVPAQVPGL